MDRVQVEILTCNRPDYFYGLIVSLRNQTLKEWDLIIVDESDIPVTQYKSIMDLITRLKLEGHGVRYIRNMQRFGIGKSRNIAIENAFPSDIHCRIDDDSLIEPDYLERMYNIITKGVLGIKPEMIGAVGGLVPPFGAPFSEKSSSKIKVFNEIKYDEKGNIVQLNDDGGHTYFPNKITVSHHLRSSFMFRLSAAKKAGMHPEEYGFTGYREETDFCMRLRYAGYYLFTDTGAFCYHLIAPSGGARLPSEQYRGQIAANDEHFKLKFKRMFMARGLPFDQKGAKK